MNAGPDNEAAVAPALTREEQLEWEAAHAAGTARATAAAGLLLLGGTIASIAAYSGRPTVGLVQGLGAALRGQAVAVPNPHVRTISYFDHHALALILGGVASGISLALLAVAVRYLHRATIFRRPETPTSPRMLSLYAGLLAGAATLAQPVVLVLAAHHFVTHADRSRTAVENVLQGTGLLILIPVIVISQLVLGVAVVMTALNAMRAGLLTRFLGILGIIAGVVLAIGVFLGQPPPIIQVFWLMALAALFARAWPGGVPAAWAEGRAIPWPSQQELREARQAGRTAAEPAGALPDDPDPEPAPAHPASKKRRRKRRR